MKLTIAFEYRDIFVYLYLCCFKGRWFKNIAVKLITVINFISFQLHWNYNLDEKSFIKFYCCMLSINKHIDMMTEAHKFIYYWSAIWCQESLNICTHTQDIPLDAIIYLFSHILSCLKNKTTNSFISVVKSEIAM